MVGRGPVGKGQGLQTHVRNRIGLVRGRAHGVRLAPVAGIWRHLTISGATLLSADGLPGPGRRPDLDDRYRTDNEIAEDMIALLGEKCRPRRALLRRGSSEACHQRPAGPRPVAAPGPGGVAASRRTPSRLGWHARPAHDTRAASGEPDVDGEWLCWDADIDLTPLVAASWPVSVSIGGCAGDKSGVRAPSVSKCDGVADAGHEIEGAVEADGAQIPIDSRIATGMSASAKGDQGSGCASVRHAEQGREAAAPLAKTTCDVQPVLTR